MEKVYDKLMSREIEPPVVPYMDIYCLVNGMDFKIGFLAGLKHSKVAVLFISIESLEKMKNAAIKSDNVLLEVGRRKEGRGGASFNLIIKTVAACNSFRRGGQTLNSSCFHKTNKGFPRSYE